MGLVSFPIGPRLGGSSLDGILGRRVADRRNLLKGGVGLGLASALALGNRVVAQELSTPEGGYVGSDPQSPSTGDASPVPGQPQPFVRYDPVLAPVEAGAKRIEVVARDAVLYVAKEVPYAGWTFDGTIPGRALRVREGDQIDFTFKIDPAASTAHSLDFHSAITPPDKNYKTIMPGEEFSWTFTARYPGAYMYHCGTPPVLMHIGAGMYGAMIVDPKDGWSPARELCFVQSEFYLSEGEDGVMVPDYTRMASMMDMSYVTFNGHATQYVDEPIPIKVGEPVRIFVVNAGPNIWSSFHVVGAIFDKAYVNAHPANELRGLQSISIGPGDGACVEFTVDEPGEYVAVNHAFGHAAHGAIAILNAE